MTQYVIRRLLLVIPTIIGVSLLVTALLRLFPGDAVDLLVADTAVTGGPNALKSLTDRRLSEQGVDPAQASFADRVAVENSLVDRQLQREGLDPATATDAQRQSARNTLAFNLYKDEYRARLGLDKNYLEQWWDWSTRAVRGDLGESVQGGRSVSSELKNRLPVSIELGMIALVTALVVALPVGVLAAVRQDSWLDYVTRSAAIAMLALPSFFVATMAIILASRWFGYSFPFFYKSLTDDPIENLKLMLAPGIILGFAIAGGVMRLTRAQMLEVMRQDYIRTARAKGLAGGAIILRHGVRNAFIPVVTVIGIQIPVLIGGSLVLEQIFGIPGVSQYFFAAIRARDFPPVIGVNIVVALVIVLSNLVVDVAYAVLDPRIRYA
jgi:peptide/nickel transport system permease protein